MTIPAHLLSTFRQTLLEAAARECNGRARHYPGQIERREIGQEEAEGDWQAWVAIEAWLADGLRPDWIEWEQVTAASAKALERRRAACDAAPADQGLAARREAVAAIHAALTEHHAWLSSLTDQLRDDACKRTAAA